LKDDLDSLTQRFAEELSKYIYFLLAASGAAIAYALDQADGKALTKDLILLVLALLGWCGSFYFGVRHLRLFRQHMIENAKAHLADETFEQMQTRLEPFVVKMEGASNLQHLLFIGGVFLYISWRVVALVM